MFYAQLILAKKSSLSRLWMAVHWEKKLTKAQVYETNVPEACAHILRPYEDNPKTSLALRISAHLLLGVCRITYKKTSYLLSDCTEVYSKIKDAVDRFRSSAELMMNEASDEHQINIREAQQVDLDYGFDLALPDVEDMTLEINLKNNLSRMDDITLKDDFTGQFGGHSINNMEFGMDDFGEQGVSQPNFANMQLDGSSFMEHNRDESLLRHVNPFSDEPFEALQAPGCLEAEAANDLSLPPPVQMDDVMEDMENDRFQMQDSGLLFGEPNTALLGAARVATATNVLDSFLGGQQQANGAVSVLPDEDPDSFQLDSLDSHAILENKKGQKRRKRRLFIIDNYTEISSEELKANIDDYEDLIRPSEIAPPTRALMRFKETGGADILLSGPSTYIGAKPLVTYYKSNCVLRIGDERTSIDEENARLREELDLQEEIEQTRRHNQTLMDDEEMMPLAELDLNDHGFEGPSRVDAYDFYRDNKENIPPMIDGSFGMKRCDTPPEVHRLDFPRLEDSPRKSPLGDSSNQQFPQGTPAKKMKLNESSRSDTSSQGEDKNVKRIRALQHTIAHKLNANSELKFSELLKRDSTRKAAAQKFYAILALKKQDAIDVKQMVPYEEIYISKGPKMDEAMVA